MKYTTFLIYVDIFSSVKKKKKKKKKKSITTLVECFSIQGK